MNKYCNLTNDTLISASVSLFNTAFTSIDEDIAGITGTGSNALIGTYSVSDISNTNTYTGTFVGLTYFAGLKINLTLTNQNTSSTCTLNINSLGAKSIKVLQADETKRNPVVGELAGTITLEYDGTDFKITNSYAGLQAIYRNEYDISQYCTCNGTTDDTSTFNSFLSAIGTTQCTLYIPVGKTLHCATAVTIPYNITLRFGGAVKYGVSLTINGYLEQCTHQCFLGTGTLTLGKNIKKVHAHMFGAKHYDIQESFDNYTAFTTAFNIRDDIEIELASGWYKTSDTIILTSNNVKISGSNGQGYGYPPQCLTAIAYVGSTATGSAVLDTYGVTLAINGGTEVAGKTKGNIIQDIWFHGGGIAEYGLICTSDNTYLRCICSGNVRYGFYLGDMVNGVTLDRCTAMSNVLGGMIVEGAQNRFFRMLNCFSRQNYGKGLVISSCVDGLIDGGYFESNGNYGVHIIQNDNDELCTGITFNEVGVEENYTAGNYQIVVDSSVTNIPTNITFRNLILTGNTNQLGANIIKGDNISFVNPIFSGDDFTACIVNQQTNKPVYVENLYYWQYTTGWIIDKLKPCGQIMTGSSGANNTYYTWICQLVLYDLGDASTVFDFFSKGHTGDMFSGTVTAKLFLNSSMSNNPEVYMNAVNLNRIAATEIIGVLVTNDANDKVLDVYMKGSENQTTFVINPKFQTYGNIQNRYSTNSTVVYVYGSNFQSALPAGTQYDCS